MNADGTGTSPFLIRVNPRNQRLILAFLFARARRPCHYAKPRVWVGDCSVPDKAPDLWLRDGDVIEVPEK